MPRLKSCKSPDCDVRKPREEMFGPMKEFCSVDCGYALSRLNQEKKREEQRKQWRREAREFRRKDRERKASMTKNTKGGPVFDAQLAVNAFIAARDHHKPCIVHGWECEGAEFHAGHFHSVGSTPELRFNTWNIHKQCATSNSGNHKYSRYNGRSVDKLYEQGLVARIGQARVDWLNGPHEAKQYRLEDFKRIARIFRKRAKLYKKFRGI